MQTGLEYSFRPDPSKPISVNIAADFHRSNTHSRPLTRTIAFRARGPTTRRQLVKKEEFEKHLHTWLLLQPEKKKLVSCQKCGKILILSHVSVQIIPTVQKPTITALTISENWVV